MRAFFCSPAPYGPVSASNSFCPNSPDSFAEMERLTGFRDAKRPAYCDVRSIQTTLMPFSAAFRIMSNASSVFPEPVTPSMAVWESIKSMSGPTTRISVLGTTPYTKSLDSPVVSCSPNFGEVAKTGVFIAGNHSYFKKPFSPSSRPSWAAIAIWKPCLSGSSVPLAGQSICNLIENSVIPYPAPDDHPFLTQARIQSLKTNRADRRVFYDEPNES